MTFFLLFFYKIDNNIATFDPGKEIIFFTVQIKSNVLIWYFISKTVRVIPLYV
jgi:selenocysteine lyase/cysteine desulfurase